VTKLAVWTETTPQLQFICSVQASCRAACTWTVRVSLKLSRFEPTGLAHLDYYVWGAMPEKYQELQPMPKMQTINRQHSEHW